MTDSSTKYFATKTGAELASELMKRWNEHHEWLDSTDRLGLYQDSADAYYGRDRKGWSTRRVERDSTTPGVLKVRSNHYGSTARSKVTVVTSKPLTFQVHTTNTDARGAEATAAANGLIDYVKQKKKLEQVRKTLTRHAINYTAGYVSVYWDGETGEEIPSEVAAQQPLEYETDAEGQVALDEQEQPKVKLKRYGDLCLRHHTPVDVAYDYSNPGPDVAWHILRHWESKFDLAAKWPALASQILNLAPDMKSDRFRTTAMFEGMAHRRSSDLIPVYRFLHKKTPALPDGAEVFFLSDSLVISQDVLRYEPYPVVRCAPEDMDDSPEGHSDMVDQLSLQQAHDASLSLALSKDQASMPKIVMDVTANLGKQDLGGGFSVLTVKGNPREKFEHIEYQSTADKNLAIAGYFQNQIETGTGINSVIRGNPEQALKSGSGRAYAFIQAQAAVNNSGLEGNVREAMAHLMEVIFGVYRVFHDARQKLVVIAGQAKEAQVVEFLGKEDLQGVCAVTIEPGDPLTGTAGQRMELLDFLADKVKGLDLSKAHQIITTGRWDGLLEEMENDDASTKQDIESLARGQTVPEPLMGQNHPGRIKSALALVSRPGVSADVAMAVLSYATKHAELWRAADPLILAARGIPPAPPPMPMGPPMPGAPTRTPPPAPGGQSAAPPPAPAGEPENPGMPTLPDGSEADPFNQGAPAAP